MKRKAEAGHARRDRGDEEKLCPAVEAFSREQAKQDDKTGEDSRKTDQHMNYCVYSQDYGVSITCISMCIVTSRFGRAWSICCRPTEIRK
jgi:hypothetical protein